MITLWLDWHAIITHLCFHDAFYMNRAIRVTFLLFRNGGQFNQIRVNHLHWSIQRKSRDIADAYISNSIDTVSHRLKSRAMLHISDFYFTKLCENWIKNIFSLRKFDFSDILVGRLLNYYDMNWYVILQQIKRMLYINYI